MESFAYKTKPKDPLLIDVFFSVFKYVQQAFLDYFFIAALLSHTPAVSLFQTLQNHKN